MAEFASSLAARESSSVQQSGHTVRALLTALLVLVFVALVFTLGLYIMRQLRRRNRNELQTGLPIYEDRRECHSKNGTFSFSAAAGHQRASLIFAQEKEGLVFNTTALPTSPVPEIRITFPEEIDDAGKRQSGRVVVVRVGEHSVGLEPLNEDLPPYQQSDSDRFQSLDLDRIGGLKEKNMQ